MQQTEETPRRQPSRTRRLASSWYLPATVFVLSCAMTFGVYGYILHQSEVAWRSEVSRDAALITAEVRDRLRTHAQFLRSVRAFFTASETVTPAEWSRFSQQLQIERNIPGIQIYGYAAVVDGNRLATFVSERQRIAPSPEGTPPFSVSPPVKTRGEVLPLILIAPETPPNRKAIGFNLLSEARRSEAIEQARDRDDVIDAGEPLEAALADRLGVADRGDDGVRLPPDEHDVDTGQRVDARAHRLDLGLGRPWGHHDHHGGAECRWRRPHGGRP